MSSRDKVVDCVQFDSLSGKICFDNILRDWRYEDPTKFSNLTVKLASPHLVLHLLSYFLGGGTNRALWNQLWAVHLLILTVAWFITALFGVHTHLLSNCVTPRLLLTPSLASCFSEGALNGFSWTAGLLIGFMQLGMFLSFSSHCKQWERLVVPSVLTEILWGKCVSTFVTFESFKLSSVHPGFLLCLFLRDCPKLFLAREIPEFTRNISVLIDFVIMTTFRKEYRGFSASTPTYFW